MVTVICSIYGDVDNLLPHFLKHYTRWKVDQFAFSVYRGEENPSWGRTLELGKGYPISLYHRGGEHLSVDLEGAFKNEIRSQLGPDDYYIPTDLDEFNWVLGFKNFPEVIAAMKAEGADYVQGEFVDRITEDGSIPMSIDPSIPIDDQFPRRCHISDTICKAWCEKLTIAASSVEIIGGHHQPLGPERYKMFSKKGITKHFKWFGPLYEKEKLKYETYTLQQRKWVNEQANLLRWLDENNGKLIKAETSKSPLPVSSSSSNPH